MAVSGIVSGADATSSPASTLDRATLGSDFDSFLHMLTTELKNQDPLSPMDSSEFTNQLVMFSQVEQAIKSNKYMEELISLTQNTASVGALSYIDKTVQVASSHFPVQDGEGKFAYYMPEDAKTTVIAISDASGKLVRTVDAELTAGRHVVEFDGLDSDGNQLPDGAYNVTVTSFNHAGDQINPTIIAFGRATGVASEGGQVYLALGDVVVPLDYVLAVHASEQKTAAAPPPAPTTPTTP
ncbi:basal-body rod modification protein FlgD [Alphaproteobacteria bacterium]|nr:basal-body rod modification protein FlgD [Alphaproteobacteria bacterium]